MHRSIIGAGLMVATLLGATACAARGDAPGMVEEVEGSRTTQASAAATGSTDADFGTIKAPCGPGNGRVKEGEGGKGSDRLYIGIPNDRTSEIRPGLLKELWDAGVGYAKWCNAQGGIAGLKIEPVDVDSKLLSVEAAMASACNSVFAFVGGGMTQDNLQFSGKDGSDFHKCRLIDIPAFAVSPEKTDSNGQVQPVPNPTYSQTATWVIDYMALYPESKSAVIVWGDLPSLRVVAERQKAAMAKAGLPLTREIKYSPLESDFLPTAQQVVDAKADTVLYVGEPENLSKIAKELKAQGWSGRYLLETNMYDPKVFASGKDLIDGALIRSYFSPFEEADRFPAVRKYIDITKAATPDAKIAQLGEQAVSAWLLFTVAATECAKANGGEISRDCVLVKAAAQSDWTGGGLHAPMDPGKAQSSPCGMLIEARGGTFSRRFPEIGGTGDDGSGFHCPADGVVTVNADLGSGKVDPSRPKVEG